MPTLKRGFIAPEEVTSYFERKQLRPAFSWQDVWAEEHAYAFTVAKAVDAELLTAFKGSITTAIQDGKGFERWREDIRKELARLGWLGPRMVKDPTGQDPDRMVNFASDRRLKTIFWSNMNSARSAGQRERVQRTKKVLPYILYVRTTSADPRPEHLAWVGLVLPVDHPFWKTHWPPNGWLCKCQVRQISAREAASLIGTERVFGKDQDGNDIRIRYTDNPPDLGPDQLHRNRRTGEITTVPAGIDPGWHTNPGLARASTLIQNLNDRLATAPAADATAILKTLWEEPYLRIAPKLPEKVWLPAGVSQDLATELGASSPVVSLPTDVILKRFEDHGMNMDDFALLPAIIHDGHVLPDPKGKKDTRSLIWRVGKVWWRSFISVSNNGWLRVNSLHERDLAHVKREFARANVRWPFED